MRSAVVTIVGLGCICFCGQSLRPSQARGEASPPGKVGTARYVGIPGSAPGSAGPIEVGSARVPSVEPDVGHQKIVSSPVPVLTAGPLQQMVIKVKSDIHRRRAEPRYFDHHWKAIVPQNPLGIYKIVYPAPTPRTPIMGARAY